MKDSPNSDISKFILSAFRGAFDFINPYLGNYQQFSKTLARQKKEKETGNIQYDFDLKLDEIFKNKIKEHKIFGKFYSEESGWFELGRPTYKVIVDPFCNSTLASRTFLEAAAGISVFTGNNEFVASGIIDYQMGIAAIANEKGTSFFQVQTGDEINFDLKQKTSLAGAWISVALETKERRKKEYLEGMEKIFEEAGRVLITSGHYVWLKLAAGFIDGYIDTAKGQKLYEMFAATVAQKSGCIVTGMKGEDFDVEKHLKIFEKDPNFRFKFVAARNKELHGQIMESLK